MYPSQVVLCLRSNYVSIYLQHIKHSKVLFINLFLTFEMRLDSFNGSKGPFKAKCGESDPSASSSSIIAVTSVNP